MYSGRETRLITVVDRTLKDGPQLGLSSDEFGRRLRCLPFVGRQWSMPSGPRGKGPRRTTVVPAEHHPGGRRGLAHQFYSRAA